MFMLDRLNLGHGFKKYFTIRSAHAPPLRDEVFRIRHEVYCEELGFEPLRQDRLEIDEHDAHSMHCLLQTSQQTAEMVGCTRLVMCRQEDPAYELPFERTCANSLDRSIVDPARLPRDRIAEVSRLAVRHTYRHRRGDQGRAVSLNDEDFDSVLRPRFPYIPVSLYMGAIALAERSGIDTIFVLTEPRLAAHFARLGVEVRQIGAPIEHRGVRVPSMMDVSSIVKNMRFILRPLWRVVREEIEAGFAEDTKPAP